MRKVQRQNFHQKNEEYICKPCDTLCYRIELIVTGHSRPWIGKAKYKVVIKPKWS